VVGIYGVIAYLVARRSQEIGVRMALGATRAGIVRLMLGHAMWPVAIGLATGLALAASLTGFLSAQLFGVSAYDPVTFTVVVSLLAGVALAACLIPSSRAAAIDPTSALRP
jgi:ABC-type antimicrobial peptide transport system permease subunit